MVRRILTSVLLSTLFVQIAFADPVTYRQLRPEGAAAGAAFSRLPQPASADNTPTKPPQSQTQNPATPQGQGGRVQESPNHPEFVRLPDGRIVKYGPGIICDENCIEAVPLARARVSRNWYVLPPLLAAGILCAVLCRGGADAPPAQPPIVLQPSPSPTLQPTPVPPNQVPEPGTLILLGTGLATLLARRKLKHKPVEE
ncbi:MAG: PEP-CTERM sorting domain-containing protein [Acidobacteria bacterium]|nr:PEP-CTERM sorting domain-containing protein [Acidobacteriota bacterium]MBI3426467.1 PEP-CTERM sorting domain-containing protein [Acidobacteriota bacterium]